MARPIERRILRPVPEPTGTAEVGRFTVRRFAELDSTNRYLLDEAAAGARDGLVAVADHQTAGRGRLDRRWEAPPGSSLLVSVLIRPAPNSAVLHTVVIAAALALADAVARVAGFTPALKWPNDLVVGDRKLAGLLAEQAVDALVVGAGCNVQWDSFPADLASTATSCNAEAGRPVDRDALLDAFLDALDARLASLDGVPGDYRARLATLGRRVRAVQADGELVGVAVDVRDSGALVLRDDAGREHEITTADVIHLRSE
jgi:BirA family biotin operon repressor/biotin-[acetyl-CoA-carboxylase] ligase